MFNLVGSNRARDMKVQAAFIALCVLQHQRVQIGMLLLFLLFVRVLVFIIDGESSSALRLQIISIKPQRKLFSDPIDHLFSVMLVLLTPVLFIHGKRHTFDLLVKQIRFIEKHNEIRRLERFARRRLLKQRQRLIPTSRRVVFIQHLIVRRQRHHVNHHVDARKHLQPFASLRALSADIRHAEQPLSVVVEKHKAMIIDDTCGCLPNSNVVIEARHIVWIGVFAYIVKEIRRIVHDMRFLADVVHVLHRLGAPQQLDLIGQLRRQCMVVNRVVSGRDLQRYVLHI
mmetsp:Transcript_63838/g.101605  ORF Transcript_63838/g.101605 Transcript_63838/m.101605 type:complete len:285 (-) Transcript_63838:642-1496(-)